MTRPDNQDILEKTTKDKMLILDRQQIALYQTKGLGEEPDFNDEPFIIRNVLAQRLNYQVVARANGSKLSMMELSVELLNKPREFCEVIDFSHFYAIAQDRAGRFGFGCCLMTNIKYFNDTHVAFNIEFVAPFAYIVNPLNMTRKEFEVITELRHRANLTFA